MNSGMLRWRLCILINRTELDLVSSGLGKHPMWVNIGMQDLPRADKMLSDVVTNVQVGGICKHFSKLFAQGQGLVIPNSFVHACTHLGVYSRLHISSPEGELLIGKIHPHER